MFVHLLAGSLMFLFFGKIFGFEISRTYLVMGAFFGFLPDLFSYVLTGAVKLNKWAHTHRNNFSHSIFLPVVVLVSYALVDFKAAVAISAAMFTHPILDLFDIGWGVKLLYPFSGKTFKMFYKGKIMTVWNQKEADAEAEKFGDNYWIKNIYFTPNLIGISEWASLAGFIILVVLY